MKATVINCKKLSLRKHPWITPDDEAIETDIKAGTEVEVDTNDVVYNWQGRNYYKVKLANGVEGYAPFGALSLKVAK